VDWWNTLHQPATLVRLDGPAVHPSMMVPLLLMAFAYMAYFVTVLILRLRAEILARKLRAQRLSQSLEAPAVAGERA
jgi:heme exporter protein C